MTKNLLNGIKIVIELPDACIEEVFPISVGIESYGKTIIKTKINNFSQLKELEIYWSKFNTAQYGLVIKHMKDLGYN